MSREPVHILAARLKPSGRQAIWQAIRATSERFTVAALITATDVNRRTITGYLQCLCVAGIIARFSEDGPPAYYLVRDEGVEAPRVDAQGNRVTQGLAREQMWRTMKLLGSFSAQDLAVMASTEVMPVSPIDALDYCRNLAKAGYLRADAKLRPPRWSFIRARNTGPRPPMVQRLQTVFDPNLGRIVWHPEIDG